MANRVTAGGRCGPVDFRVSRVHGLYEHVRRSAAGHPLADIDRHAGIAAAHALDLADWQQRLASSVPADDAARLADALRSFEDDFERDERKHRRAVLAGWQRLLEAAATDLDWERRLGQIASFYGSAWPPVKAFVISLLAVADDEPCRATVEADVVTLHLPGAARDAARYLGIVAHELCHAFENDGLPADCRGTRPPGSPTGRHGAVAVYGRLALPEALATAIGNGWTVRQLTGRVPPAPWYDDWHVATFAAALYPQVEAALSTRRALDAAFVDEAVRIYGSVVGERMWDPDHLFGHLALLVDDELDGAPEGVVDALCARLPRLSDLDLIDGTELAARIDRLLATDATRLVVLASANLAGRSLLEDRIGWLRDAAVPSGRPFVAARVGHDEPATYLVCLSAWSQFETAWLRLHELRHAGGVLVDDVAGTAGCPLATFCDCNGASK